jgi:hypothetical protein
LAQLTTLKPNGSEDQPSFNFYDNEGTPSSEGQELKYPKLFLPDLSGGGAGNSIGNAGNYGIWLGWGGSLFWLFTLVGLIVWCHSHYSGAMHGPPEKIKFARLANSHDGIATIPVFR